MPPAFKLLSPETGTEYWIFVVAPDPAKEPGPWPAVLFMDGDNQFDFAVKSYRAARRAGKVPPLLLVGVGYGASYGQPANKRGRDYTQTAHSDEPSSGGAKAFMKFLTRTLWPELARRYPLQKKARGIAGHSLGSLVVLYVLFQSKPFFTHYLASAPSIWWDNRSILAQAKRLRARQSTLPAQLYLSVGENDSKSMTGDLTLLEEQLAAKPFKRLRITSQCFPEHDHYTALSVGFRAGLAALLGTK